MVDVQQEDCIIQFLMGLNESFSQIRAQVLMIEPLPSLSKVFSLVVQEERQRTISMNQFSISVSDSLVPQDSSLNTIVPQGFSAKQDRQDRYFCTHCKMRGHSKERCFKVIGYPSSFKNSPRSVLGIGLANLTVGDGSTQTNINQVSSMAGESSDVSLSQQLSSS